MSLFVTWLFEFHRIKFVHSLTRELRSECDHNTSSLETSSVHRLSVKSETSWVQYVRYSLNNEYSQILCFEEMWTNYPHFVGSDKIILQNICGLYKCLDIPYTKQTNVKHHQQFLSTQQLQITGCVTSLLGNWEEQKVFLLVLHVAVCVVQVSVHICIPSW